MTGGIRDRFVVQVRLLKSYANTAQAWENRLSVPEEEYSVGKVRLPAANEIPNVDLQVINFHRPIFGTFHAKFTVIDRRIALLQSSNIQDNDNLEMLTHIEGPIVDSFYDAALLSWGKPLDPPLPLLNSPAKDAPIPCHEAGSPDLASGETTKILPEHTTELPHYDTNMAQETQRVNSVVYPREEESLTQAVTRHLSRWPHILHEILSGLLLTNGRYHDPA